MTAPSSIALFDGEVISQAAVKFLIQLQYNLPPLLSKSRSKQKLVKGALFRAWLLPAVSGSKNDSWAVTPTGANKRVRVNSNVVGFIDVQSLKLQKHRVSCAHEKLNHEKYSSHVCLTTRAYTLVKIK